MRAFFLNTLSDYIHLFAFAAGLPPEHAVDPAVAPLAERGAANPEPVYPPLCSVGLSDRLARPRARRKEQSPC